MSTAAYFLQAERAAAQPARCFLSIDIAWAPIAISSLEGRKAASFWIDDDAHRAGYSALCELQGDILMADTGDLTEAINRVYMAVRQMSTGEAFAASLDGSQPLLPVVPPALATGQGVGLLGQLAQLPGTIPGGLFGIGERPATIADIWAALRPSEGEQADKLLDKLDLLGDATDVASLYNIFRGSVTDVAEIAADGGLLVTLLIGLGTLAATAGAQAAQLDQLIARLDTLIAATGAPGQVGTIIGEAARTADLLDPTDGGAS